VHWQLFSAVFFITISSMFESGWIFLQGMFSSICCFFLFLALSLLQVVYFFFMNYYNDNAGSFMKKLKEKRELGLFQAVMIGLGGALGFEIFVLTDYAYFDLAGSSITFSLLLGGLINLLIMFSYCELATAIPRVGGEYTYTKAAYGGIVAFISGCLRWLASVFGAALAALTFSQQFAYLILKIFPAVYDIVSTQLSLIAIMAVIVLAAFDIKGARKIGTIIVVAFLVLFAIFVTSGVWYGLALPVVFPEFLPEGLPRVFVATAYTFPIFFGMRALVASAPLIKNPEKNIPMGILLSAVVVIPIYVSLVYVAAGVVSPEGPRPSISFLNFAAEQIMGISGGILFAIAGMVTSLSALDTSIDVQSSIARGMSRDGYLPKVLLSVHRRFETHYIAIITGSIFIMLLSATGTVAFLGYAASFGSLLVFALANLSLMKLRKKRPHLKRPFKTPLYPITPIAGILMSLLLLVFPIFIRDVNAESALVGSFGLMALVLITYHLRMIGYNRIRVAFGGMSLGVGGFIVLLAYLIRTGYPLPIRIPSHLSATVFCILIFTCAISVIAGIMNIITESKR